MSKNLKFEIDLRNCSFSKTSSGNTTYSFDKPAETFMPNIQKKSARNSKNNKTKRFQFFFSKNSIAHWNAVLTNLLKTFQRKTYFFSLGSKLFQNCFLSVRRLSNPRNASVDC